MTDQEQSANLSPLGMLQAAQHGQLELALRLRDDAMNLLTRAELAEKRADGFKAAIASLTGVVVPDLPPEHQTGIVVEEEPNATSSLNPTSR